MLARLQGVRQTGQGRWTARCPAHEDKRASLSIRETDDSRLLVHCFGGCSAGDVVAAVGLTLADLFDRSLASSVKPLLPPAHVRLNAVEALAGIQHESLVVVIVAEKLARGESLVELEHQRLIRAASTITSIVAKVQMPEPPEIKRLRRGDGRVSA
jgi:hypothetical protein